MRLEALKHLKKKAALAPEKVTVAAPTEEGLKEGLSVAKKLVEKKEESMPEMEDALHEAMEESEDEMEDESEKEMDLSDEAIEMMSPEELKECIKKLRD